MGPQEHVSLLIDRNLEAGRADAVALITEEGDEVSFADVHRLVCRFAQRLSDRGVRREERVLLVMDDTPHFHAAFLGTIRVGAVPVPVNFMSNPDDFGYFLEDSYAVMTVVDPPFVEAVRPFAERLGVPLVTAGASDGDLDLDAWLAEGPDEFDPVTTHRDDPAMWQYSSGSTGRPKGVVHLQHDAAYTAEHLGEKVLGLTADDRVYSTSKLFHTYGLGNALTFPLWVGACAVQMTGRPTAARTLDRVEQHRPTALFCVPALYNAMLAEPGFADRELSSVRMAVSAAEPLPAWVWHRWNEQTGIEILDGIGSTEMLQTYCINRPGEVRPGSAGRPVDGYELQLRDPEGTPLPDDAEETGELWVAGDSALAYYHHQHEKTKDSIQGRWFRSGDRFRRDADGYYWYEGRVDDMIKVKGLWVSPIDVENRLIAHDAVSEAAVVGVDRQGFASIVAYVILNPDHEGGDEMTTTLQQWCKDGLQRYEFPREIAYVDDLPRTATGKIQRFKLRQRA